MDTRGSRDGSPATLVLIATMVALYLLEAGLGAPDYVPALVRLGALVRERVLAGEIWRLISCTFLHGSVMHLAFNMVVLWSLGQMLERTLGTARFLVMYVAAGIGGSLLSLVADTAVHRVDAIYWIDAPAGWDDLARTIVLSFRAAREFVKKPTALGISCWEEQNVLVARGVASRRRYSHEMLDPIAALVAVR